MHYLIDGLLEYSRVGRQETEKKKCNLEKLIDNCISSLSNDNVKVIKNLDVKIVTFNETRLSQVICNLIENGIKYNDKEEKKIVIASKRKSDYCEVSVSDNGLGIDGKYYGKIFQIFQTLSVKGYI
jgi:light-regulated signal transduction histidine kinase (bacteriophytochrome)